MIGRLPSFAWLAGVLALAPANSVWAHPHVFVDGKAEFIFDANKRVSAIRNIWRFDQAYSTFADEGMDANGDGKLSKAELAPLAKVNVNSLKDYAYFTYLSRGKTKLAFKSPTDYFLTEDKSRLTLSFTLPLARPAAVEAGMVLEIFDAEYFVAFSFPKSGAATLINAPAGCSAVFHPPHVLDAATMAKLATIPADQRNLPPALQAAAVGLANLFTVGCKG